VENKDYWKNRWKALPVDGANGNIETYPLKYALQAVKMAPKGRLLDAGCGAGRVIRYFHARGYDIDGFDFIPEVIEKLHESDPTLSVTTADVSNLPYRDDSYACVMGFGLYHNLPLELQVKSLQETRRVMSRNSILCASFRADNITTRISDMLRDREDPSSNNEETPRVFHKINLRKKEIKLQLEKGGFSLIDIKYVENMPILYKFTLCRHSDHRIFNEKLGRQEGYKLNALSSLLHRISIALFPEQFCNVYVAFARASLNPRVTKEKNPAS
jgi:SAM-dependent methyltransferase